MLKMNRIYLGDCLEVSKDIESGSVDLVLTDLPFGTVYGIGDVNHGMSNKTLWDVKLPTKQVFEVINRILRKNGKMVLFAQEPFTNELRNNAIPNLPFSYRMIWEKDHFANCLLAKKACVNYYEDILVFSKKHDFEGLHPLREYSIKLRKFANYSRSKFTKRLGHGGHQHFMEGNKESSQFSLCTRKTYNELIAVFEINKMQGFKPYSELKAIDNNFKKQFASTFNLWQGKKYKSNIFKYKKDYNGFHPTQKPILLLEDLIKTFSNENDLVVDLTCGSGSTCVAAKNTNRRFIGIEKEKKYYDISVKRLKECQVKSQLFR